MKPALEIWKVIPGYEGRYQASTQGRIRSLDREITQLGREGKPFTRKMKGRVLRPGRYAKSGHVSVVLGKGTNGKPVHQLILLAFVGPVPEEMEVRHLNGDPTDNSLANLVYGSRSDNILDVYRQGKAWRKLTVEDVQAIRKDLKDGRRVQLIADEYDVTISTIYRIRKGETYSWLES